MLEAKNISVRIGKAELLTDVTLTVRPGELTALVGPNGAGKSTLLKVISGSITPVEGRVSVDGKALANHDDHSMAKKRAVLSQSATLDFPFSVRQVAMLGRNPHIIGKETLLDERIIKEALFSVEAEHLYDRKFVTLSGGEQQRVQLARVLSQIWDKPDNGSRYLFLDEPTNGLDIAHQHMSLQVARGFADNDTGVVAVLHDLNLASQYADKVMILNEGECFAYGSPKEVFTAGNIEEAFGVTVAIIDDPTESGRDLIVPTGISGRKTKTAVI